jgi:hypothetical protein
MSITIPPAALREEVVRDIVKHTADAAKRVDAKYAHILNDAGVG